MPDEFSRGVLSAATTSDFAQIETVARETALSLAVDTIDAIGSDTQATVRDILPGDDLDAGGDLGVDDLPRNWTQPGLAAGDNTVYQVDSGGSANDKIIIIFAVASLSGDPVTSEIAFETGSGGTFERLQIEGMRHQEEPFIMLKNPIVYGAKQNGSIRFHTTGEADADGVVGDEDLMLHGVTAEQAGNTIEDSSRNLASRR